MNVAGILLLSFVVGSVPVMNIAARRLHGVDLREFGGGTVSGTALYRLAGFLPLAVAGCFDVAKGMVGPLLAGDRAIVAAFAGGVAVVGHNWSPFLRGQGGRGIAPALGALIVTAWPGAVVLVLGLLAGKLVDETALGALAAEISLAPVLAIVIGAEAALAGAAIAFPMLLKRVLGNSQPTTDRRRVYLHRLLYDTDSRKQAP